MGFADSYFQRFKSNSKIFSNNPRSNTGIIIVIPCYDEDEIDISLKSIENAIQPKCNYEVIVVVNSPEDATKAIIDKNRTTYQMLKQSVYNNFTLLTYLIEDVPKKFAGVGNARKVGMDEALRRFNMLQNRDGVIVSLDADTIVSENYLIEIESNFINSQSGLATFQFKHDFNEEKFSKEELIACKLYETYLRYFRLSLKYSGFPYPIHTIGSCFAVKAEVYAKAGGMSRRQGGEDFYFLHKSVTQTSLMEINKPIVYPSPRISDRVPFGTGPAVSQIIVDGDYKVYNYSLFGVLKKFFDSFSVIYADQEHGFSNIPLEILDFFSQEKVISIISECRSNTSNEKSFIKRMFTKFDAFQVVKFLNSFDLNSDYPPENVLISAKKLLKIQDENMDIDSIYDKIYNLDLQNI
ncbi:MAG: hypothetical protein C0596_16265 [Marinilabiliales bacterium]|nr:MAG: hypothetical protein C0596_16265 [Marinilabiliales bacterium]